MLIGLGSGGVIGQAVNTNNFELGANNRRGAHN
jgi:hypothetical protein